MKDLVGRCVGAAAILAVCAVIAPTAAAADQAVTTSVRYLHGHGAIASTTGNLLTISDTMGIENRIYAYADPAGRLVLTAPEGLGDPDGAGTNCGLDNVKPGEETAQQVSCGPGYIAAIVGTLGGGNDVFDADPALTVSLGDMASARPLSGGAGRDRLIGAATGDLIRGGSGIDSLVGAGGDDFLMGGSGSDKLNGGAGQDTCWGGGDLDTGRRCELSASIP